jgi:hypothetical protein
MKKVSSTIVFFGNVFVILRKKITLFEKIECLFTWTEKNENHYRRHY